MNEIFSGQAHEILDAFLNSEAKIYNKYVREGELNESGKEYVKGLKEIIAKEIKEKHSEGFDFANFFSLTNMGLTNLSIGLTPSKPYWNWKNGNIDIFLCPCGRLEHWGSISLRKREN